MVGHISVPHHFVSDDILSMAYIYTHFVLSFSSYLYLEG